MVVMVFVGVGGYGLALLSLFCSPSNKGISWGVREFSAQCARSGKEKWKTAGWMDGWMDDTALNHFETQQIIIQVNKTLLVVVSCP